jgi:hypothetical protein
MMQEGLMGMRAFARNRRKKLKNAKVSDVLELASDEGQLGR